MEAIVEFFERGGGVMLLLLVISVAALAIFLFRTWFLRRPFILPHDLRREILAYSQRGELERAETKANESDTAFGRIASALLSVRTWGVTARRERLKESGKREAARLERFSGILGTIATVSPLLGLLGTIIGMIETFRSVQETAVETGVPSVAEMADGIWQALLTTAAGLVIAIPAFVGYRWLTSRVDEWTLELEEASSELLHAIELAREASHADQEENQSDESAPDDREGSAS
jgi:biopolymer transport protein ExbB